MTPTDFTAAMLSGKIKKPKDIKNSEAANEISRKVNRRAVGDLAINDRQIKKLCALMGVKKFKNTRTRPAVVQMANLVHNRKGSEASMMFQRVQTQEPILDEMRWVDFLKLIRMAKTVK